jgi:hypothetical protein
MFATKWLKRALISTCLKRKNWVAGLRVLLFAFPIIKKKKKKYSPYIITHFWSCVNLLECRVFPAASTTQWCIVCRRIPIPLGSCQGAGAA